MKNYYPFVLNNLSSLYEHLVKGLKGFALSSDNISRTHTFWCFLSDGTVLKVQSELNDIDGWHEVGTLEFSSVEDGDGVPNVMPLDDQWRHIQTIEKLCLDTENCYSESGIVLTNMNSQKLTIICDANPYSISVQAPFLTMEFLPEYEILSYKRIPF
jgi:hypothetical protein